MCNGHFSDSSVIRAELIPTMASLNNRLTTFLRGKAS